MEEFEFYIETCFWHMMISLTTSTGRSKRNLLQKKQNKKTASGLLRPKNDNEEGRVTGNKDDGSEMGEMIAFTQREIQIFIRKTVTTSKKRRKKARK